MYVRSLRLAGFKSFAHPTVLEFERGVNVIVGPNGSGKSNIADALSWVLGSQAPSTLRGASMEDVIFAGSSERPRLDLAEVELTLDNASRLLPLDLAEVTIARSTDRSGLSEYRINGAACRLLDIAELLSDTGIGRSIHTIVGQGQLDAVLQARPEDRRDFIEEAAHIGKFRKRKERALRKIERVDDNLTRLHDVLGELRRAIRPLKRQATAAAAYSELVGRHRELKQRLVATEIRRLQHEEATADPEAEAREAAQLADELAHLRAALVSATERNQQLAEEADRAQRTAHRMARSTDALTALARLARERAARFSARLSAETEEAYRERLKLLESERDRWMRETEGLQQRAREARNEAEAAAAIAAEAQRALASAEEVLAVARDEEIAAAQALVRAEGSEAAGRATLGSIEARVRAALERREVAASSLAQQRRDVTEAEHQVRVLERELDQATAAAAEAEAALEAARERAEEQRDRAARGAADAAAADARVRALEDVVALFLQRPDVVDVLRPLIARAADEAEGARAAHAAQEDVLRTASEQVEWAWAEVGRKDQELRRVDALMSGSVEKLAGARRRFESREIELAALDDELARAREALAAAETAIAEERAALPARRGALREREERRAEAERRAAGARREAASAADVARDLEMRARTEEERVLAARLRAEEAEAGIADARAALEGLTDLRTRLQRARERAEQVAHAAALAADAGVRWSDDVARRAQALREQVREAELAVVEMRERERALSQRSDEVVRRMNSAEVRRAEARARVAALEERALDEWGIGVAELSQLEGIDGAAEDQVRAEVERLERDMRRLGAVNPHAAEEYAELAERERFLEDQIADLRASKADLLKVVRDVDATIEAAFSEAFADVATEFEAVFDRLFPGGSGSLKLTEPGDVLNSGIEIEARPPGKNVRKLSLLSGGERSLVALAFLFAIFRSRPSPFYLLDEVEAALDDVNLHRFLRLVEELEQRAQILIVTHQKRTMEAADVLYGVSMGKDGVSHVVAKRLEDVPALAP